MAVAVGIITVSIDEIIFRYFQDNRDQGHKLADNVLMYVSMEFLDLGVVGSDNVWMGPFILREELEDVVHLDIVSDSWEQFYGTDWAIAVVVSIA